MESTNLHKGHKSFYCHKEERKTENHDGEDNGKEKANKNLYNTHVARHFLQRTTKNVQRTL